MDINEYRPESFVAKLPLITALFWVMKILATTLGETGGDVIGQTLNLGYLAGIGIFVGFLVIVLALQLRVRTFHPVLFWAVILATSLVGTEISDYINDTLGLGYGTGALILIAALVLRFAQGVAGVGAEGAGENVGGPEDQGPGDRREVVGAEQYQ